MERRFNRGFTAERRRIMGSLEVGVAKAIDELWQAFIVDLFLVDQHGILLERRAQLALTLRNARDFKRCYGHSIGPGHRHLLAAHLDGEPERVAVAA